MPVIAADGGTPTHLVRWMVFLDAAIFCVRFFFLAAVVLLLGFHDRLLSFTVFQIQVYGGPYQWTVYRRFSEFRDFHAELEDAGYTMESLPPLPQRTFLPSTRAAVVRIAL